MLCMTCLQDPLSVSLVLTQDEFFNQLKATHDTLGLTGNYHKMYILILYKKIVAYRN